MCGLEAAALKREEARWSKRAWSNVPAEAFEGLT